MGPTNIERKNCVKIKDSSDCNHVKWEFPKCLYSGLSNKQTCMFFYLLEKSPAGALLFEIQQFIFQCFSALCDYLIWCIYLTLENLWPSVRLFLTVNLLDNSPEYSLKNNSNPL